MTASSTNRETVRDALATLLQSALVGTGKPVQEVTAYERGEIGASPLIMVLSGGSRRKQHGMNREKWKNHFRLVVRVIVKDADAGESWTEQNVEDSLDLIEKGIADVLADNRGASPPTSAIPWNYITFEDGFSIIGPVKDRPYILEELSIIAEVNE